jgi:hypothetical protein
VSESLSVHKARLASELLEDIERTRLRPPELLLKAVRLARLVDATEVEWWLHFELNGYVGNDPIARKYLDLTGRWIDRERRRAYLQGVATIDAQVLVNQIELQRIAAGPVQSVASKGTSDVEETQNGGSDGASNPIATRTDAAARSRFLHQTIRDQIAIRTRVLALLHDFVTRTYYRLTFTGVAESVFERYRAAIDVLLGVLPEDPLSIAPLYERLAAGDRAAANVVIASCRQMIRSFADAVFPAQRAALEEGGARLPVEETNYINRINAHLYARCANVGRRVRLGRSIATLEQRLAAADSRGEEPTPDEAQAILATTYLTLGEILHATTLAQNDNHK